MLKLRQGKTESHATAYLSSLLLPKAPSPSQKRKKQKENTTPENKFLKNNSFLHFKKFRNKFQFRSIIQHLARLA